MDEQLVLTAQTLKLSPDLKRTDAAGDVFVVKNIPTRKYLTVSAEQWNLLRNFANPATVPDVLRAVILNRTCLPLREYYELVLKAHQVGILQGNRVLEPEARARSWFLSLSPWVPIILTVVALGICTAWIVMKPIPEFGVWPHDALKNMLIGWLLLSAGLSLGQVLAASVLHSGGGEVYDPRLHWLRPVPYFGISFDDACMTTRRTQVGIWCACIFPVAGTAAVLWFYRPHWGFLHLFALLVMLRPFADGCVPKIISAIFRGAVLDTQRDFAFSLNRLWRHRVKVGLSRMSIPYVAGRLLWGAGWILLVVYITLRAFNQNVREVLGSVTYWREVGLVFAGLATVGVLLYVGVPAIRAVWASLVARWRLTRQTIRRWTVSKSEPATPEQISRLLAESLLFRRISPADRSALIQLGQTKIFGAKRTIHHFTDKTVEVGVILSGKVRVYRRTKAGRAEKAMYLAEGDVFGAHAIVDPDRQHVQVKTVTPVVALMIPVAEFDQRIVQLLGVSLVHDLIHKVPFLRNVSFCSNWHPQAMARFAQLAAIVSYNEGDAVIVERQDSRQFYIVYEGSVSVRRKGKLRGRLKPESFFGEVSILQNSAAISDMVAREQTRCFTISKADFLRFVTHNPVVSLQLEEISSNRLGRPIFPLSGHSFDVR